MISFYQISSWYTGYLHTFPLLTKSATTAAIGLIGDGTAQYQYQNHKARLRTQEENIPRCFRYDKRRGLASVANNIFLTTPIYHYGYDLLESLIPIYAEENSVVGTSLAAFSQVLIDCILFDALFVMLMFLCSEVIEGRKHITNVDESKPRLVHLIKTNLLPAIYASWKMSFLMIPIEYILFRYFPLHLRVLGMNFIDLVWEAVVSFVIHDDKDGGGRDNGESGTKCSSSEFTTPDSTPSQSTDDLDLGANKSKLD